MPIAPKVDQLPLGLDGFPDHWAFALGAALPSRCNSILLYLCFGLVDKSLIDWSLDRVLNWNAGGFLISQGDQLVR